MVEFRNGNIHQNYNSPDIIQAKPSPDSIAARSPALSSRSPALSSKSPGISKRSPAIPPKVRPYDTVSLLVCVAEEYFGKARKTVQQLSVSLSEDGVQEYRKLIAVGLACLEAALQSNKLSPRQEAKTRFRYAFILSQETENLTEAETALSKGIAICDKVRSLALGNVVCFSHADIIRQHRYVDLKYSMQYLLLKVLFQRNQRAAFVAVDRHISDAIAYVYPFVFRRFRVGR
jgi:hypothetical protein